MALCVESKTIYYGREPLVQPVLVVSESQPCTTYYLVEADDLQSQLSAYEVGLFIAGAISLYGMAFVFKLGRQTFGLR